MKLTKKYNSPKWNLITLGFSVLVTTTMLYYGDYGTFREEALIVFWIPLIYGIFSTIVYLLSRLVVKRFSWVITAIAIILMFMTAIPIFFGAVANQ